MSRLATSFQHGSPYLQATNGAFLTEDEMRARLPSIFAEGAHESRSQRYTYVPTIDIVRGLGREGFRPTFAVQARTRNSDMYGFTKHMMRFRRDFDRSKPDVAEVVLVNSHGGQSSAQLFGGWFRFICTNGMVVGDKLGEVRVQHKGNIVNEVIEGTYRVVEDLTRVGDSVETMKAITLNRDEQLALANSAAIVRFDLPQGEQSPVAPEQFLRRRRFEDERNDLWTTFNRVQENVIRGGLHGVTRDANNRRRNMTTREVNGIDQNVALNRALWSLADAMAQLKA